MMIVVHFHVMMEMDLNHVRVMLVVQVMIVYEWLMLILMNVWVMLVVQVMISKSPSKLGKSAVVLNCELE